MVCLKIQIYYMLMVHRAQAFDHPVILRMYKILLANLTIPEKLPTVAQVPWTSHLCPSFLSLLYQKLRTRSNPGPLLVL